jgi:hypothetical protein
MKVALELFLVLASVGVVALFRWFRSWGVVVLLRSFRSLCFFVLGLWMAVLLLVWWLEARVTCSWLVALVGVVLTLLRFWPACSLRVAYMACGVF